MTQNLDAFGSFSKGFSIGDAIAQRQQQQQTLQLEQQKLAFEQQQLEQKNQQAQAKQRIAIEAFNNPQALQQVYAADKDMGKAIAEERDKYNRITSSIIGDVVSQPIEKRQDAWNLARATLEQRGIATDDLPEKYSPQVDSMLRMKQKELRTWDDTFKTINTERGLALLGEKSGEITQTGFQTLDIAKDKQALRKGELDAAKTALEIKQMKEGGGIKPEERFRNTTALRQDYLNNSKTFQGINEGYERVKASAADPSPAGDLALIFGYMKTLDPNSTVREGEFANAQNAGSAFSKVGSLYNRVVSGKRLTDSQRKDFVNRSEKLYTQAEKSHQKTVKQYEDIAKRNSLDPRDVVVDFRTTVPVEEVEMTKIPAAPAVGVVEGGYEFLGGNPASPTSWRKI